VDASDRDRAELGVVEVFEDDAGLAKLLEDKVN
jgi:hypothetical protein